ncbi:NAD-dependent dehydratase [Aquaspirillum sp. LM1]|uniref:complex I NDUFA9 subunit family protein n=1 Tax=Aquaspirillum sp. LM1 TaxID=1938604 RepID=UPI0009839CD9|nr:complex I NDUFA9 subunit family protein [Aquaspirillum sp. LM1]AQR64947.1 NAD-dependent dehydratase [Aquaspirillum sp. LM1]
MSLHPQRIALIGGTGFVGQHLAEQLVGRERQLTLLTRRRERSKALGMLPGVRLLEGGPAALDSLLAGQDAAVHMVGILHGSRRDFERAHVQLTEQVIAACQRQGVRRLVLVSALGAGRDAPSDYQQTKALAEEKLIASGLDWTIIRPSVIFGQGDSFLTLFARLLVIAPCLPLAGANTRFQPVWVEDVVRVIADCLDRRDTIGQRYELTGPETFTLAELVRYVGQLTGHPRPVFGLPKGLAMLQAALMECLPNPPMSRDNVRSLACDNVSVDGFPQAVFGFAPSALTSIAPGWLGGQTTANRYDAFRSRAQR